MTNLEKKIDNENGDTYIINKDNNQEVEILNKKVDSDGEEIFLIRKDIKDKNNENKINKVEIQIKKDPESGKEIIVNKLSGNILNNMKKIIDKETGEKILINKETGEKIDNLIRKIDTETGEEIYVNKEKKSEIDNNKKEKEYIIKKSEISGKDIIMDKETGEINTDLEIRVNPTTKALILYNNETGEEIKKIKRKINPETKEEEIIVDETNNKNENNVKTEIISIKDKKSGKEILVNKLTGEKLNNLEIYTNPKTRKSIIINKETGKEIKGIKRKIDNETNEEIFIKEENPFKKLEIISEKDKFTGKEYLINKETGEKLNNLEIKINNEGNPIIINKETNEEIKGIKRKIDPENRKEIFIKETLSSEEEELVFTEDSVNGKKILKNKETGEKLKNFEINEIPNKRKSILINKETGNVIKELNIKFDDNNNQIFSTDKKFIKNKENNIDNNVYKDVIEFSLYKDPRTGKQILVDKETGESDFELKYDISNNNKPFLMNKETGEKIYDIKQKINPKTKEENFEFQNIQKNNLNRPLIVPAEIEELEIQFDNNLNDNIIINKKTGERENNIIRKNGLFIDKNNGKILKNIISLKEPYIEQEKIFKIKVPKDKEGYELPIKINNLEVKKDPISNEEIIYNKDTELPIKNIIRVKNPENGKNILINRKTGEEYNNIIMNKDPETGKIIYTKFDIVIPLNKDYIEITTKKDEKTGKEILINKNTGEEYHNIEIKYDEETGEKIFKNKETGKILSGINIKKNPITLKETYIFISDKLSNNEKMKGRNYIYREKPNNLNSISIQDNISHLERIRRLKSRLLKDYPIYYPIKKNEKMLIQTKLKKDKSNSDLFFNILRHSQKSQIVNRNEIPFDNMIESLKVINRSTSKNSVKDEQNIKNRILSLSKNIIVSEDELEQNYLENLKIKTKKNNKKNNFIINLSKTNKSKCINKRYDNYIINNNIKDRSNISNSYKKTNYKSNDNNVNSLSNKKYEINYKFKPNYLNKSYVLLNKNKKGIIQKKIIYNSQDNIFKNNEENKLSPDLYLKNLEARKFLFDNIPIQNRIKDNKFMTRNNYYFTKEKEVKIFNEEKQNTDLRIFDYGENDICNGLSTSIDDNFYLIKDSKIKNIMLPNALEPQKFKYFK